MNENISDQIQATYIPDTKALSRSGYLRRVIPLVVSDMPNHVCGTAHRVGYTSVADGKQPLYRLKLYKVGRKGATLPGFFLLVNGVFVQYVDTPQQEEYNQVRRGLKG